MIRLTVAGLDQHPCLVAADQIAAVYRNPQDPNGGSVIVLSSGAGPLMVMEGVTTIEERLNVKPEE